jgi:hypothetical protein
VFRLTINTTPDNIERLRTRGPQIIAALTEKMTQLMFKLQSKIVGEEIPQFFPNGAPNIAASVRAIPAELQGTIIRGEVQAGGTRTTKRTLKSGALVDYAAVQHAGISHSYQILPFNKKALRFILNGNVMIRRSVTHPGLRPRPFMQKGLDDMQEQIIAELDGELAALLA